MPTNNAAIIDERSRMGDLYMSYWISRSRYLAGRSRWNWYQLSNKVLPPSQFKLSSQTYSRSNNKQAIAVADDFGKVRVFKYPAIYPKAPSDFYRGHSAHVTRVTFTADDRFLLSAGGADAAILQWAVSEKSDWFLGQKN